MAGWYYSINDEQHGPVSAKDLKRLAGSGQLQPDNLVRKNGTDDWTKASGVNGLFPSDDSSNSAGQDESFDPYRKWLGIPKKDQPPTHYRLLGVDIYESDPDVIDTAANKQMAYLHGCATGEHAGIAEQLLNEISAARLCLLDPDKKVAYDEELRKSLIQEEPPTEEQFPPAVPTFAAAEAPIATEFHIKGATAGHRTVRRRRKNSLPVGWIAAAAVGVVAIVGGVWWMNNGGSNEATEQLSAANQVGDSSDRSNLVAAGNNTNTQQPDESSPTTSVGSGQSPLPESTPDLISSTASGDAPQKAIQGEWVCIGSEENGVSRTSHIERENRHLTIKGNSLTMESLGGTRRWVGTFKIDSSNGHFDWLANHGSPWIGIYSLDGDILKLCWVVQKEGRSNRPTQFKTFPPAEPGMAHAFYTFKREHQSTTTGGQVNDPPNSTPRITGTFLVRWRDSAGKTGDVEYEFKADGSVRKAGRLIGRLTTAGQHPSLDFDEDRRGSIVFTNVAKDSFTGTHTWADGTTATWTATRLTLHPKLAPLPPIAVGGPASQENAGSAITLFENTSTWTGNRKYWTLRDGETVGSQPEGVGQNHVFTDAKFADFRLTLKFKATKGNTGVYFRATKGSDARVRGYQVDIRPRAFERNGLLEFEPLLGNVKPTQAALTQLRSVFRDTDWNDLEVTASGHRIVVKIDGVTMNETSDSRYSSGAIGFQLSGPTDASFKDVQLTILAPQDSSPPQVSKPELVELRNLTEGQNFVFSSAWMSADGLTIYWQLQNTIWTAQRDDANSQFKNKKTLLPGRHPTVTGDGLQMIFLAAPSNGQVDNTLWITTRDSKNADFTRPRQIREFASISNLDPKNPSFSIDGLTVHFIGELNGERIPVYAVRESLNSPWQPPKRLPIDKTGIKGWLTWGSVSDDGLAFFCSNEGATRPDGNLLIFTRSSINEQFSDPKVIKRNGLSPLRGRAPRYIASTNELIFTRAVGRKQFGLWLVKGFKQK